MDSTLVITLILLLAGALISGLLKGRERDRVLKSFAGFHVTIETLSGSLVWGDMVLHPTGIELIYRSDVQDEHHIETSYILYKDEFPKIQAIYRYCDIMDEKQWTKRERELHNTFHPNLRRRLQRHSRNLLSLMSDSLTQAIGILAGYVQSSSKRISLGSDQYLSKVGQNIIGYVGTKYDPLLERYVGTRVVVEVVEGGVVYEHIGILKDYTADFLEVLDVQYPSQAAVELDQEREEQEQHHMKIRRTGNSFCVTNTGDTSLYLESLRIRDDVHPLNAVLDKDDDLELFLPAEVGNAKVELDVKEVRHLDWILPRAHSLVRHKAERYDPDQVFDIGVLLKIDQYTDEEGRYLKELENNPDNAAYAVELGQLLFQRGAMGEAERWFQQALKNADHLPDGGKLAARQLRSIEIKKEKRKRGP